MTDLNKFYDILGLEPGASQEEIRQAYREIAEIWQPDRFPKDPTLQQKARERLNEIKEAYNKLKAINDKSYAKSGQAKSGPRYSQSSYASARSQASQTQASQRSSSSQSHGHDFFRSTTFWILAGICIIIVSLIIENSPNSLGPSLNQNKSGQSLIRPVKPNVFSPPPKPDVSPLIKDFVQRTQKPDPKSSKFEKGKLVLPSTSVGQKEPSIKDNLTSHAATEATESSPKTKIQQAERLFSIGSSQEEVLAIQGPPDKTLGLAWIYGDSTVTIYDGKVESYVDKGNLKARIKELEEPTAIDFQDKIHGPDPPLRTEPKKFGLASPSLDDIAIGMTKAEVSASHGQPTEFKETLEEIKWWYGESWVVFKGGVVIDIYSPSLNLLKIETYPNNSKSPSIGYFSIGSTKAEVLAIQGYPTEFRETLKEIKWWYGESRIVFKGGRVSGIINSPNNPLRVKMTPTSFGPTSRNYFVAGSTAEELLAVQGKPDKILGLAWHYGNSTVTVYNGRVESFINKGNLKVKITDEALLSYDSAPNKLELIKKTSPEPRTLGNITVGSTKDEVLAIQGTPTELGEYRWKYGFSVVNFQNGRVVSWYNSELDPLKVKLEPSGKASTSRGYFTVGSTKDDVLAIQGTPTELGEYRWKYGFSVVNFQNGRVVSWYNSELDPLKARMK